MEKLWKNSFFFKMVNETFFFADLIVMKFRLFLKSTQFFLVWIWNIREACKKINRENNEFGAIPL